jgi:nicotinamidase-related amidase
MPNGNVTAALLVVDMLQDFFVDGPLAARRHELIQRTNELVDAFHAQACPVIWVRQEFAPDLSDAFLEMRRRGISKTIVGTAGAQLLPELHREDGDVVVIKKRYSAFFRTNLDDILGRIQPGVLVVLGVNTHACIRATVVDAYQRDCSVIVADECDASYDMEQHELTKRYLDGKLASFRSNQQIVDALGNQGSNT